MEHSSARIKRLNHNHIHIGGQPGTHAVRVVLQLIDQVGSNVGRYEDVCQTHTEIGSAIRQLSL